jgi:hypothetical protein
MIAGGTPSFAQGYAGYGAQPYSSQQAYAQPAARAALSVPQWFAAYDQIRRQAQMTPAERREADSLLSQGFSVLMPGEQKVEAERLLTLLVKRYSIATQQIRQLPVIAQTQNLQQGYYQYFATAQQLFSDYLKVENDIFAQTQAGTPLATELLNRKQALEQLNTSIQSLDAQLRAQLGVVPYHY